MQLNDALRQISDIRAQMARSRVFRGYRSITVGFSGALGLAAAVFQRQWVANPEAELGRYLALWLVVAGVSVAAASVELVTRVRETGSDSARHQTLRAVEHFLPAFVVGALLTLFVFFGAPQVAWMLPGLWSLLYGLGIFAADRSLPRPVFWVGVYFVLCGFGCLYWGQGEYVFSPWLMGVSFGGGQLMGATILYWNLERSNGI